MHDVDSQSRANRVTGRVIVIGAATLLGRCGGDPKEAIKPEPDQGTAVESLGSSEPRARPTPVARLIGDPTSRDAPLQIGERAPRFRGLPERARSVIVFFRGAWWVLCREQLVELQKNVAAIEARGARVVALSPESPEGSETLQRELQISFPVLSDPDLDVAAAYGVRQGESDEGRRKAPLASTFVTGEDGVVRFVYVGKRPNYHPPFRDILGALAD
jgi:peroxiredoxin